MRYPADAEAAARAAAALLDVLRPVVDHYLGEPLRGDVRLELLSEPRVSGANPVTGVIRHAVRGFGEASPRAAGLLSYQLGRIAWHRTTGESRYLGPSPRSPDWLVEAALLPLAHAWSDRAAWVDYVADQVALFRWRKPFPEPLLRDLQRLGPRQRLVATAQCVLRTQVLARWHPDWVRALRYALAADAALSGVEALERVTATDAAVWEERFATDLDGIGAALEGEAAPEW